MGQRRVGRLDKQLVRLEPEEAPADTERLAHNGQRSAPHAEQPQKSEGRRENRNPATTCLGLSSVCRQMGGTGTVRVTIRMGVGVSIGMDIAIYMVHRVRMSIGVAMKIAMRVGIYIMPAIYIMAAVRVAIAIGASPGMQGRKEEQDGRYTER